MSKHTEACDHFAELLSVTLDQKEVSYVNDTWLRTALSIVSPCWQCKDQVVKLQSSLSGRIYQHQMPIFLRVLEQGDPTVIDLFQDGNKGI